MRIDISRVETSLNKNTNVLDKISDSEKLKVRPFSMYDRYTAVDVYWLVDEFNISETSELTFSNAVLIDLSSRVMYGCIPKLTKYGISYVNNKLLDDLSTEPSASIICKYTKFFHMYYSKIGR